jgi:VWFA-related protein
MTGGFVREAAFLALAAALLAQTPAPQQAPVFRANTTVVPLTVTVLDQKGVPIKDLTAADFVVFENGKQREVVNFFPQNFVPLPPGAAANRASDGGLTPETGRTFLIALGYGRIQYPNKSLDGAIQFVREQLLPQDQVSVMAFHRVTPFTTDHAAMVRILERYKATHEKLLNDIWEASLNNVKSLFGHPNYRPVSEVLKDMDEVLAGAGVLKSAAELMFQMDRAVNSTDPEYRRQESFADVLDGLGDRSLEDLVIHSNRFKLFAGIEYLRDMTGDKNMVFLGDGGLARGADDAKVVGRRANDARITLHMVSNGFDWSSRDVVEATGGYYTSLEMAAKAMTKLDQATRFSYLLGYTPVNPALDGKSRDVSVKVNRKDVTVRFQHGYDAVGAPDPAELKELLFKSRLESALAYTSNARDITVNVEATLLPRMGVTLEARVVITIDPRNLTFAEQDGIRTGKLELQVYCSDAKERVIGTFGEALAIKAGDETYQDWLQTGIKRTVRVPLMDVPKYVKVLVYDYGSDHVGTNTFTFKDPGKN